MRLTSLRLRQNPFAPGSTHASIMMCATDTQVRALCAVAIVGLMLCIFQAIKPAPLPIIGRCTSNPAAVLLISLALAVIRISVKKRHERLRAKMVSNEMRCQLLFSKSLTGAYRSTLDGRILDCNVAFFQTFGYATREEMIGQSVTISCFSQADQATSQRLPQAEKGLTNLEQRLRGKDGGAVCVLNSAALVPMRSEKAWSSKAA